MITVRLATLSDSAAIAEIHKSWVTHWERIDASGELHPATYESLSLYERWQHGGPWLSIETCAVHLNRLLAGSGIPLVAELDGQVLAEAEVYESYEPAPFGHNLELAVIITHAKHVRRGLGRALISYVLQMAKLMKCERVSVSDAEIPEFYEKLGFVRTNGGRGIRLSAGPGRIFYQSTDLTDRDPAQVNGWHMQLGRFRSSRQEWDKLFPQDWAAGIPDLLAAQIAHVKLAVSGGQNAILFVREADEVTSQPGDAHLSCWSSRPLSGTLITAIRDWAYKGGYKALLSYVMEADLPLIGVEGVATDYRQDYYEITP